MSINDFDKPQKYHTVVRTSPKGKGQPFIGKCIYCGKTGLKAEAALSRCDAPNKKTIGQSIIDAIEGNHD